MKRNISTEVEDFEDIRNRKLLYVDKTMFIKEWWDSGDYVTFITRPEHFGKTMNVSMINCFFSTKYADRSDLFEGLDIWQYEEYRKMQGTYPVIFLSFADIKAKSYEDFLKSLADKIREVYSDNLFLLDSDILYDFEKKRFTDFIEEKETDSIGLSYLVTGLCRYLKEYYGKKVIILLDGYDIPMREAYLNKYWDEIVSFMICFFLSIFKTNQYLETALITGLAEIVVTDHINSHVVTITSNYYSDYFGFTEDEVFDLMNEYGYANKDEIRHWYGGVTIGKNRDMYNPYSIVNFLKNGELKTYCGNGDLDRIVSMLLQKIYGVSKTYFAQLMNGESVTVDTENEIIFPHLDHDTDLIWNLLAANGYLRMISEDYRKRELEIANYEVYAILSSMRSSQK